MTDKETMNTYVILKLVELYGMEYLKSKINNCWYAFYDVGDCGRFMYMFEDSNGESKNPANEKGWKVYATIDVNKTTFETSVVECVLP